MSGIHPYCFVRTPCISLEYCCKIWKSYKIIGVTDYDNIKEMTKRVFQKEIDLKYVYVPIFGDWSKMEQLLSKLSADRYFGGTPQYSLSWNYVSDTLFRDASLNDIPSQSPSEFHELSFDVMKTIGCSRKEKHVEFVKIEPSVHSNLDIFSLNTSLSHLEKVVLKDKNQLKEIPDSLETIDHPEISIDYDEIISFLSKASSFISHKTYLENDDTFKKMVLVIKKSHNLSSLFSKTDENQLHCIYWDIPFRLRINHKLSTPSDSILIFKNVWSVNEELFSFYNAFLRDYCFHEEDNLSTNMKKTYCKTDQTNNPKNDYMSSVDNRLGFRGSVNVNGSLFLDNLVSDHQSNRKIVSQYNTDKLSKNIKFLGIGVHSIHFDMNIVSEQYKDKSHCPFGLSRDYYDTSLTIYNKEDQKQEDPYWRSNPLSKSDSTKIKKNGQPKPPFYFSVLWILDNVIELNGLNSVHFIIKDNRNQDAFSGYQSNNSESGYVNENSNGSFFTNENSQTSIPKDEYIETSNVEELETFFSKNTSLTVNYFTYLLRRLLPFIKKIRNGSTFSSKIKIIYMKKSISSWVSKIESILDEMLPYGKDNNLNQRLYKMPFIYNDSRNYFKSNCKLLYTTLKKEKYKRDLFCGCFSLDKNLVNFGMIKTIDTKTTDIYIDYDYENLLKDCRDVIFIALEICKICRSDIQEILMGSKMTWFSRLCEYLCSIHSYPKPNVLCNIKSTIIKKQPSNTNLSSSSSFLSNKSKFNQTQHETEINDNEDDICTEKINTHLEDIKKSEVDKWKLKGGDISGSLNYCHIINEDYSYSENGDNSFIGMVDFDAFYNSIICEYKLGYICYNPYAIKNGKKFYMSKELTETFNYLVNTRRELKSLKNKSESDIFRLNALKRVGNSFFGCAGMETSPVRSKILSNLITFIGRASIVFSREVASKINNSFILMSHTDSLCLKIIKRKLNPLYKINGYFVDENESETTFKIAEDYLKNINSLVGPNNFIKLLSENVYNCVHVINRTHYIAQKKIMETDTNYEKWLDVVFYELESKISTNSIYNYDDSIDIWSKMFYYKKELELLLKKIFFDRFEKEYVIKGIFTKRWSLFRRFFFCILVLSKICDKSLHMNYTFEENRFEEIVADDSIKHKKILTNNFTTFMIFRIRNLIFRSIKTQNLFIMSGFIETIDGVVKSGFRDIFLNKYDKFCVNKTDEYISLTLTDLKKSKITIGNPWNSEKNEIISNIGMICKSGWILDNEIPTIEELLLENNNDNDSENEKSDKECPNWYNSLYFDQIISDMNFCNNSCETVFETKLFDPTVDENIKNTSIMLYITTRFEVKNFVEFVKFLKSFSKTDIILEMENDRVKFDKEAKKMLVNLNTCTIGKYIILHDLEFIFCGEIISIISNYNANNSRNLIIRNLRNVDSYYDHIIVHLNENNVFFGNYISVDVDKINVGKTKHVEQTFQDICNSLE